MASIHVTSLSDYNSGHLHGVWIDVDNDVDAMNQAILEMLSKSKHPNVLQNYCKSCGHHWFGEAECPECCEDENIQVLPSAEEWAIHDSEGFGGLLGESTSLSEVCRLAELIEEHGEPFIFFAENVGPEYASETNFEEAYQGEYASEKEFAYELLDVLGELDSIPEHLQAYFDYDAYARDLFICGYYFIHGYVFLNI